MSLPRFRWKAFTKSPVIFLPYFSIISGRLARSKSSISSKIAKSGRYIPKRNPLKGWLRPNALKCLPSVVWKSPSDQSPYESCKPKSLINFWLFSKCACKSDSSILAKPSLAPIRIGKKVRLFCLRWHILPTLDCMDLPAPLNFFLNWRINGSLYKRI